MTARAGRSHVTVKLRDDADEDSIAVRCGWLPMAVWEGVRVRVTSSRGLTLMERFAIECLLELGECGADDLLAVASIPEELSNWLMSSLAQRALAYPAGQDRFVPSRAECETALTEGRVPVESEEERTFLWFPETEEFVCLPESRTLMLQLREIGPIGQFPLHERWKREKRARLISDALEQNHVYGHEVAAIRDVLDQCVIEQNMCPAYQCRTVLPPGFEGQWSVTLQGYRRQKRQADVAGADSAAREHNLTETQLSLPFLPKLAEHWRNSLNSNIATVRSECASLGLAGLSFDGSSCQAGIDRDSASEMARRRLLANRFSLDVAIDRKIEFGVPLLVSPSDNSAEQLFALDDAIRQLLAAPHAAEAIASLFNGRPLSRQAALDRLWQLKLFGTLYEIREPEDFKE